MPKSLFIITLLSLIGVTIMFLGATPSSARGFYYVIWLSFTYLVWMKKDLLRGAFQKSPFGSFFTFLLLGISMILLEETIAGITVNLLSSENLTSLLSKVPPYYANNLLLLPGFIIAWYILLRRYSYTQKEFLILVGLFGIFSEKIYIHILTLPIIGIPLAPVTMLTYIGIILPSYLSLDKEWEKRLHPILRYSIGLLFPILVSIPFLALHGFLSNLGYIDPSILTH